MKVFVLLMVLLSVNLRADECEDEISRAYHRGYMCKYCDTLKTAIDILGDKNSMQEAWDINCKGMNYCEGDSHAMESK
ncbi:MAG TPA: hypothetical protein VMV86_03600 [Methanosarcinales archaeon]|nr:hypothetical protein [Methanosarcinales archaeon]